MPQKQQEYKENWKRRCCNWKRWYCSKNS